MDMLQDMFVSCSTAPDGRLSSVEEWGAFVERLYASEIIDNADVAKLKRLWTQARPFGEDGSLSFQEFLNCLMEGFGTEYDNGQTSSPVVVDVSLDRIYNQISNLKSLCQDWSPDEAQIKQLLQVVAALRKEHRLSYSRVKGFEQSKSNEFLVQTIANQKTASEAETAIHFQLDNTSKIEQACNAKRVKGLVTRVDAQGRQRTTPHRPTDKFGFSGKSLEFGLGQTGDGDFVGIVNLNSPTASDEDVAFACNCHAAHRELILSRYFPSWMGYSRKNELYFEHFNGAVSVEFLIRKYGILCDPQPLLYSILSQTLDGLCDVLNQCTFDIKSPLSAKNVLLLHRGTRVVIGGLDWGEKVCDGPDYFKWRNMHEKRLLVGFGNILSHCLGLEHHRLPQSFNLRKETTLDGTEQVVYNRAECESGFHIQAGTPFRLDIPSSTPGKVWSCIRIDVIDRGGGYGTMLDRRRSKPISLENPERLEFFSQNKSGVCRVFLKEIDWWETNEYASDDDDDDDDDSVLKDAGIVCKITVVDRNEQGKTQGVSPTLHAILSACTVGFENDYASIKLINLREKYTLFDDELDEEAIIEDFNLFIGK